MSENLVKQLVKCILVQPVTARFFNGTLFVSTITETQADTLLIALRKRVGAVQVSPIGDTGEYAYDFI